MQKYRVLICGENLLTVEDGIRQKPGFFTNVFIEAFTPMDAEERAIQVIREDPSLAEMRLNTDDDPVVLSAEEIHEIDSFEGLTTPRDAYYLYPSEEP
jgi:hypothetical protein